jgi:hypothetical protein
VGTTRVPACPLVSPRVLAKTGPLQGIPRGTGSSGQVERPSNGNRRSQVRILTGALSYKHSPALSLGGRTKGSPLGPAGNERVTSAAASWREITVSVALIELAAGEVSIPSAGGSAAHFMTRGNRPAPAAGHQVTELTGRRDRDGVQTRRVGTAPLACRRFRPPGRAGQGRREVRERRPRRTTRRISKP